MSPEQLSINITGRKIGRPSKRLTIIKTGLKIISGKIIYKAKGRVIEHEIQRINHLPKLQEIRLHTAQMQYPGEYELDLICSGVNKHDALLIDVVQLTSTSISTK